jgi:hypothetical protein
MNKTKYYTQEQYQKELAQEKVFVNVCIAAILYMVGLGILYMGLV